MIGTILVLTSMLGVAAYQFLKGNITRATATILVVLFSSVIALGYFELLAGLLAGYMTSVAPWAQLICFSLIFLLCFALFQTAIIALLKEPISLGDLVEKIGRPLCGLILGWLISGVVLTAASMAPIPNNYPYARFKDRNPDASKPAHVLLNADGFIVGWFNKISQGSFKAIREPKSFALLHADFLNQTYLNRHALDKDVTLMTNSPAIVVPRKAATWPAPDGLVDKEGQSINSPAGRTPLLVRIGIKKAVKDAGKFTTSQLRIICKDKGPDSHTLGGAGFTVYPYGYMVGPKTVEKKRLNEVINVAGQSGEGNVNIDFLFFVPSRQVPVLAAFKLNNAVQLSPPVSADQSPSVIAFITGGSSQERRQPNRAPQEPSPDGASEQAGRERDLMDVTRGVVADPSILQN
ncbi:MAG: hypothetical protein IH892_08625 [Planctomycetes bacterium]|nr:hypothetical protein [Planctomycetota bacterium]